MDGWSIALLALAAYLAVLSLVRLMIDHRRRLIAELRAKFEAGRQRKGPASERQKAA
jgi:hypothetical protein